MGLLELTGAVRAARAVRAVDVAGRSDVGISQTARRDRLRTKYQPEKCSQRSSIFWQHDYADMMRKRSVCMRYIPATLQASINTQICALGS